MIVRIEDNKVQIEKDKQVLNLTLSEFKELVFIYSDAELEDKG
jgi:hypothetical protein